MPQLNMKIFKSKNIKELDAATCEAQGIDSLTLMESRKRSGQ